MRLAISPAPSFRFRPGALVAPVLAYALAVLLLAGVVHIATILLVPAFAETDGWSRLATVASRDRFVPVVSERGGEQSVPGLDPLFVHAACRIDLAERPAALALSARERFWSLALYDPSGTVTFSLNDRTALEGELAMAVVTPLQHAELKEADPGQTDRTIVVESASTELVALLRLYAPTVASRREAEAVIDTARCAPGLPSEPDGPPTNDLGLR